MPLASAQVRSWLQGLDPPQTISSAAANASMSRIALTQQLVRDRVNETVIVQLSRQLGLDPLHELATFDEYADLEPCGPHDREALAFIDWPELFQAAGMRQRAVHFGDRDLGPVTFDDSGRTWVEALDGGAGTLRAEVASALGVSPSSIAHSLTSGLRPQVAAAFARHAGTPVASALVVCGLLSPQEAGWARDARSRAVHDTPVTELLELVGIRSVSALRHERRVRSLEEELG